MWIESFDKINKANEDNNNKPKLNLEKECVTSIISGRWRIFSALSGKILVFKKSSKTPSPYSWESTHLFTYSYQLTQIAWKLKGVSEVFLVKHFAYERFNIRNHRYYTMLTYAFSHYGFFSYRKILLM